MPQSSVFTLKYVCFKKPQNNLMKLTIQFIHNVNHKPMILVLAFLGRKSTERFPEFLQHMERPKHA